MVQIKYIGRFAPSPTGKLHLGSLVAALASYCDAKKNKGNWLVRIEDIDPPRETEGASLSFIHTLNHFGFEFNAKITYQSSQSRQIAYQQALEYLIINNHTYKCSCSRNQLKNLPVEQHKCRFIKTTPSKPYSIKLKVPNIDIQFNDEIQGHYQKNLLLECGDVILKRKDDLFSYQLAVVVDDYFQNITDIIRGIDLIDSTPWQIHLNSLLEYNQPRYAHIPILINAQGQKLSKQTYANEINCENTLMTLLNAYSYLNQKPFKSVPQNLQQFWNHAICNWQLDKVTKVETILV